MSKDFEELLNTMGISRGANEIDDLIDAFEEAGYYDEEDEEDE